MKKIRNLIVVGAFSLLVLGLPAIASARSFDVGGTGGRDRWSDGTGGVRDRFLNGGGGEGVRGRSLKN